MTRWLQDTTLQDRPCERLAKKWSHVEKGCASAPAVQGCARNGVVRRINGGDCWDIDGWLKGSALTRWSSPVCAPHRHGGAATGPLERRGRTRDL
jgi:hypothetical protein